MGSNGGDPRQPKDLTGLLKFCIQNSAGDDVQGTSGIENDEEKRQFLAAALSSLTQSPIEQLKKGIEFVNNRLNEIDAGHGQEAVIESVDSVQDCVESIILDIVSQIDFANDFYKLNGLQLIKRLIGSRIPKLICSACDIIAETVQNNPNAQNIVTESGLLIDLLRLVDGNVSFKRTHVQMAIGDLPINVQEPDDVHVKALYAASCLIRENETSLKIFESNNGYETLLRAMKSKSVNHKLRIKSSFLLMTLIQSHSHLIKTITDLGFISQVIPIISEPHDDSHEHLLSVINFLITENEVSRSELSKSGHFKQLLESKIKELSGKEEHQEEVNYCNSILKLCFQ